MPNDMHEETVSRSVSPSRAALHRKMQSEGIPADQIDAEIDRYLASLATITVPSDAELRAMQQRGELASDEEILRALP